MVLVENETDKVINKDHAYVITKTAQKIADSIQKKHGLPQKIRLKITARPQTTDAHIDYDDWKIVIDYNSMNIQKALIEQRALEGLLAHEIMHIAHKINGIEQKIIDLFTKSFKERGLGKDMFDLMINMGMVMKDVFVNDTLVQEGYSEQLFKQYLIAIHSKTKNNILPFNELSREQLDNYFIALIGLFPAYISFYRQDEKEKGDLIKNSINWHFEDIPPEIRVHMNHVEASLLNASLTEKGINQFIEDALICYTHLLGD